MNDTHFRIYVAGRVTEAGELGRMRSRFNGKFWWEMSEDEHRRFPGDYEAQVSQGPITSHDHEHVRTGDKGIAMLRKLLREQLSTLAAGGDPVGAVRNPAAGAAVRLDAGNFEGSA